ncbi:MAG: hypothetical protein Q9170_005468 [Blastenia crenularia]
MSDQSLSPYSEEEVAAPYGPSTPVLGNLFAESPEEVQDRQATAGASTAGISGLSPHWTPMHALGRPAVRQSDTVARGVQQPLVHTIATRQETSPSPPPDFSDLREVQVTDLPEPREQSSHNAQCHRLQQMIKQAFRNRRGDPELLSLLQAKWIGKPQPPGAYTTSAMTAFFQLTYWNMDARGVIASMIRSNWDFPKAVEDYMDHRFQVDGFPGSERRVAGGGGGQGLAPHQYPNTDNRSDDESESDEESTSIAYVDEDPENIGRPMPRGVLLDVYSNPDTGEDQPCVRHERIRRYLIRDAAARGAYVHHREPDPENHEGTIICDHNETSYLHSQRNWGFVRREDYPPITFVFLRKDRQDPVYPRNVIPHMHWRGILVVDARGVPVRRFRNLPATLSTHAEGGLLEAVMRQDSRIAATDLLARMPRQFQEVRVNGPPSGVIMNHNMLAQRMARFRDRAPCVHWHGRINVPKPFDDSLRKNLPEVLRDANNTRGLAGNLQDSQIAAMFQSRRTVNPVTVDFKLVNEFPSGSGPRARSAYHPAEEHDCRDCLPRDLKDLAALNDAILITASDFIETTGICPRLPMEKLSYNDLYAIIVAQFRSLYANTGKPRPHLREIGRWTGGIQRWRSGAVH